MTGTNSNAAAPAAPSGIKQRIAHELKDYGIISAYLVVLFCAVTTYTMLLLRKFDDSSSLNYTFAIINALVIGKVILIGEMMRIGRHAETRPLYQSVLLKSLIFALFFFAFHLLEEFLKRVYHGKPAGTVLDEMEWEQVVARSMVVLCAFVPLFVIRELHRVLGGDRLFELFFHNPRS